MYINYTGLCYVGAVPGTVPLDQSYACDQSAVTDVCVIGVHKAYGKLVGCCLYIATTAGYRRLVDDHRSGQ